MLRRFICILVAMSCALPAYAGGSRWLVFKVGKDGRLETRSHALWCGPKPEGKNIPPGSVVRLMPDEPKGAQTADFIRTSTSVVYEPEDRTPKMSDEQKAVLAAKEERKAKLKDNKKLSDKEFLDLLRQEKIDLE